MRQVGWIYKAAWDYTGNNNKNKFSKTSLLFAECMV